MTESEAESAAERLKPLDEHRAEVAAQANQAFKALKGAMVEVETAPTAPAEAPRRLSLADLKTAARVRRTA